MAVKLSAALIESFAGMFLSARYDDARPTPPFHREAWELYASDNKQVGCVAPRDHAKSTGLTFDYILAEVCFRTSDYVILIGSTEDKAAEQLSNISEELEVNEDLRREFGIKGFESQQKTEIIVVHDDGHRFRILARGAEQKIRGAMWKGKRPNLIVCDDMEDDEQVENKDRRVKFRKWFFRAAKQALSKKGKIRVHGTILHEDSLLSRLMKNKMWKFLFYKAHESYNDFSNLLWPDRWTAKELRDRQIEFEEDGDSGGYSQEFLNSPLDNNESYLKKENFLPMKEADYESDKIYVAGADFAVSKSDSANRTSFTAGGKDINNIVHITGQFTKRCDTAEWLEELFIFHARWQPQVFVVEDGQIWKSVFPFIAREMQLREIWINFHPITPVKDKAVRGRSLQRRHKCGGMRFDKDADWYPGYEAELLTFTGVTDAKADDQFDSSALVSVGFDLLPTIDTDDFKTDEEEQMERESRTSRSQVRGGRSAMTGY
jgi:hypothetical protein